ncbi:MAG: vanadium-dependent haloperoxidase [Patescibacteria group bacterium]
MEETLPTPSQPPVSVSSEQAGVTSQLPKRNKKVLLLVLSLVILIGGLAVFFILGWSNTTRTAQIATTNLPTHFSYASEELQSLARLERPEKVTTRDDLKQWEEETYALVAKNKTIDPSKLYAYLSVARRDGLLITRSIYGDFYGDTSSLTKKILCEFYPDDCASIKVPNTDAFSEKLSDILLQKVKQRIAEDSAITKNYPLKNDSKYWYATPQLGLDAGSYKPWLIDRGDQFRVPENPDFAVQNFQNQLAQVNNALANITSEQRKTVIFWAGGPGTKTPPGIWLDIVGKYMSAQEISIEKYLDTQALLAMAMADSLIGCFDSKYTYQVKRPFMIDPAIKTIMPTPNHPSYPAGHSCVSSAAATVLDSQLPENITEWDRLAKEAGDSRVLGGIHYPADNEQGTLLGKQVGEYASTRFRQR